MNIKGYREAYGKIEISRIFTEIIIFIAER